MLRLTIDCLSDCVSRLQRNYDAILNINSIKYNLKVNFNTFTDYQPDVITAGGEKKNISMLFF